jgi:hypothetical protein
MINFDFECAMGHRFEGTFHDYKAFNKQYKKGMILCPLCNTDNVRRIYRGCSIQAKVKDNEASEKNIFQKINELNRYVKENFEDVGTDFADTARAMHYGIETERNIYGVVRPDELKELIDDGVKVIPIPDSGNIEN